MERRKAAARREENQGDNRGSEGFNRARGRDGREDEGDRGARGEEGREGGDINRN